MRDSIVAATKHDDRLEKEEDRKEKQKYFDKFDEHGRIFHASSEKGAANFSCRHHYHRSGWLVGWWLRCYKLERTNGMIDE